MCAVVSPTCLLNLSKTKVLCYLIAFFFFPFQLSVSEAAAVSCNCSQPFPQPHPLLPTPSLPRRQPSIWLKGTLLANTISMNGFTHGLKLLLPTAGGGDSRHECSISDTDVEWRSQVRCCRAPRQKLALPGVASWGTCQDAHSPLVHKPPSSLGFRRGLSDRSTWL